MKQFSILLALFFALLYNAQSSNHEHFSLTVSPNINKSEKTNQTIIRFLTAFLKSKNSSLTENKHWQKTDFQKYIYPYFDIYNIENSKYGKNFYQPTLMEIIPTENAGQKILKIAFIGHHYQVKENHLKSIFNIVANIDQNEVLLSRYLDFATENWQTLKRENLTYKISPNKVVNETEIENQLKEIENICQFFNTSSIPITYYSCINPKEIFEIKGFDYHPMMYIDKTGGLADYGNILFSGNNSEIYTHEIIHLYTNKLFPKTNKFLDEGIATYLAGSGKFDYKWHKNKLVKFLSENPKYNFAEHTDAYERIYFEQETSIPYLTAALIVERTMRIYGKEKLIDVLKSETNLWSTLKKAGLTKENLNEELRKEMKIQD